MFVSAAFQIRPKVAVVATKALSTSSRAPLNGVKVLDLTRVLAGPSCTMTLADYGADVYKVEQPDGGDVTRSWAPFLRHSDLSTYFLALNRNKKSVCVNFKLAEGQRLLRRLARRCDVLVENYVPGVLRKYGLDYESLRATAPRLVYCSITGFGADGPYAAKPGVDLIAASYAAFLHLTGPADGEPCRAAVSAIDLMTGLHAQGAVLAALYERRQTGRGRLVEANLFGTAIWALGAYALNYANLGVEARRMGTEHGSVVPYKSFRTANGYVTCGAIDDAQFVEFCRLLGTPRLSADPRFASCAGRASHRRELYALVEPIFSGHTTAEWLAAFGSSTLPHAPLNSLSQLFDDPHLKAMQLVKETKCLQAGDANVKVVDAPVKFDDFTCDLGPAPTLGQHTEEVLKTELGYTDADVAKLRAANVIR